MAYTVLTWAKDEHAQLWLQEVPRHHEFWRGLHGPRRATLGCGDPATSQCPHKAGDIITEQHKLRYCTHCVGVARGAAAATRDICKAARRQRGSHPRWQCLW